MVELMGESLECSMCATKLPNELEGCVSLFEGTGKEPDSYIGYSVCPVHKGKLYGYMEAMAKKYGGNSG